MSSHEVVQFRRSEPLILGRSAALDRIRRTAERVAAADVKVLITGESGVGKDLIARFIHVRSARATKAFVAVNCAALSETLLESELFGHVKGSFTGAYRDKVGKLQMAHDGTIFLDELGDMTPRMQALLLRFLENGEIHPVGSDNAAAHSNARVVAATNRDLPSLVRTGSFREDLLYRICVVHLHVPPLRDRREDIRPIAEHLFLRHGGLRLTDAAWKALEAHAWPGNVRELSNVIEQLSWGAGDGPVDVADLPASIVPERRRAVAQERRRQVADDLFDALAAGRYTFWEHVHGLFLGRDLTRQDMRQLVRRGLATTGGSYRALLKLFGIPSADYKRFLNFLAAHDCTVDYRPFRQSAAPETIDGPHATSL